jgi:hypothetical protein
MALLVDFTGGTTTQSGCTAPTGQVTDKPGYTTLYKPDGTTKAICTGNSSTRPNIYIAKSRLDTSKTGGTNTSTDVYRMIYVPAGCVVRRAWVVTVGAESTNTTATIALGDGDSTAGYMTATVPSTTVNTVTAEVYTGTAAYSIIDGKYYASADTIDVLVGTAAFTDGVYDIYAEIMDLNPQDI